MTAKYTSKSFTVKSGIRIQEKTICSDFCNPKVMHHGADYVFYVMSIMMFAAFRRRHDNRYALPVCNIKSVGCLALFSTLLTNLLSTTHSYRMISVKVYT